MDVITDVGLGLGTLMLKVFVIVLPLLMLMEWIKSARWFEVVIRRAGPIVRPLGFRPQAVFSLVTGIAFGITYGAGVLISQARTGELDARQIFLIGSFLGICHAVLEDTLLFVAVGGQFSVIALSRAAAAIVVVALLARLPWPAPAIDAEGGRR